MSAFLGPIHHWLYNKIQLQQSIVDDIYTLGINYGLSLQKECDDKYGRFENKPLEEMIDHGNIHGWLQDRVSQVEYKYAYSVKLLLDQNPTLLSQLKELLSTKGSDLGKSLAETHPDSAGMYKIISDNLLDGMPCDHANSIADKNENQIIWKRNLCVHHKYWDEVGGDINVYYELREAWLEGLAKECGFEFLKIDPTTYSIRTAA